MENQFDNTKNSYCPSVGWILLLIPLLVLATGCTQLQANFSDPSIESPIIVKAKGSKGFSLGTRPGHSYIFTSDASHRPPNLLNPEVESSSYLFAGGYYAITDRIQFGLDVFPLNAGAEPNIKWQLIGDGVSGSQLGINGALGLYYSSKTGDQNGTFGPGGYNWKGSAQGATTRFGFSFGYVVQDNFLPYFGAAVGSIKADANIDHEATADGSSPATNYKSSDTGRILSVGGGVQFGKSTPLNIGVTYSDINYENAGSHFKTQWSIAFSF